ncbi:BAG-associated GRAM protein 1 [Vitis vinifera]|uniref:BAG-associated GRAM protein 1 n=1 Tax=Vitis vinifera TaxID=29760 RepID=A0A438HVZ2_VITVI|nr:BAG-associated GRAM protein 1 [Vitis vinifera]
MKYVWIEESPNTASDCGVAPPKKGDGLRSRRGTTRKVEEHFPRHVQGFGWRKSSRSFAGKTVWRADGDKNPQKRRSFWCGRCRKKTSPEVRRKILPAFIVIQIRRSQHAFINPAITIILRMGAGGHGVPPLGSPDG